VVCHVCHPIGINKTSVAFGITYLKVIMPDQILDSDDNVRQFGRYTCKIGRDLDISHHYHAFFIYRLFDSGN